MTNGVRGRVIFLGSFSAITYKSIATALVGLPIRNDYSLLDLTVDGKVLAQALVRGVIGQASDEQFGPRRILLLNSCGGCRLLAQGSCRRSRIHSLCVGGQRSQRGLRVWSSSGHQHLVLCVRFVGSLTW